MLAVIFDDSNLAGEAPELLKVDQPIHLSLVALIEECEVLLDDGEEGNQRRYGGTLELPVLGHVMKGIHVADQVLQDITTM